MSDIKPKPLCDWDAGVLATHSKLPQLESRAPQTKRAQRRLERKGFLRRDESGRYHVTGSGAVRLMEITR